MTPREKTIYAMGRSKGLREAARRTKREREQTAGSGNASLLRKLEGVFIYRASEYAKAARGYGGKTGCEDCLRTDGTHSEMCGVRAVDAIAIEMDRAVNAACKACGSASGHNPSCQKFFLDIGQR